MVDVKDIATAAMTAWKENRGGGARGMQTVINCIVNSTTRQGETWEQECLKPWRYSSMTDPNDPEYDKGPKFKDPADVQTYFSALTLAKQAADGNLPDLVGGATLYYAPGAIKSTKTFTLPDGRVIPFPENWNPRVVVFTVEIAHQVFFREV